ncbi:MAG: hypothetical protein DSZ30_03695 [Aquificaceae bacterium]|nr:MAG: hypothetical protein DSZ30_03695 [Aquificaceae bacterium]
MVEGKVPYEVWWWRKVTEPLDLLPGRIQETREKVYQLGYENHPLVKEADEDFILFLDEMKERAKRWEVSFVDDETQPLEKWWWHPNKILKGEYPAEKLPLHLRKIYLEEWAKEKVLNPQS